MVSIKQLANFIQADTFWNAQVAQIDITPDRTFEMVPTIGNHIVGLGNGEDIEQKFKRLFTFYNQVWTKVGLEKYSRIDVQYKGQVVATRRGEGSAKSIDSAKAREAFFNLLTRNKPDTIDEPETNVKPVVARKPDNKVERVKKENNTTAITKANTSSATVLKSKVRDEIAKAVAADRKENNNNDNMAAEKDKADDVKAKDASVKKEDLKPKAVMKKPAKQQVKKGTTKVSV
jgi:cell division protein FtsQ